MIYFENIKKGFHFVRYDKENLVLDYSLHNPNTNKPICQRFFDVPETLADELCSIEITSNRIWQMTSNNFEYIGNDFYSIENFLEFFREDHYLEAHELEDINTPWCQDTPIYSPICWGDFFTVKLCVENGANLEYKGEMGYTPVSWAYTYGRKRFRCLRVMLEKNPTTKGVNEFGEWEIPEQERLEILKNQKYDPIMNIEKFYSEFNLK